MFVCSGKADQWQLRKSAECEYAGERGCALLRLNLAGRPQPRLQLPFRLLNLVHARSRDDIITLSQIKYNLLVVLVPRYYPASTWVDWALRASERKRPSTHFVHRERSIILFSKQTSTLVSRSPSYSTQTLKYLHMVNTLSQHEHRVESTMSDSASKSTVEAQTDDP